MSLPAPAESDPKRVLADASRGGVERVFLIGPDEAARGKMRVRDLAARDEREVDLH